MTEDVRRSRELPVFFDVDDRTLYLYLLRAQFCKSLGCNVRAVTKLDVFGQHVGVHLERTLVVSKQI
jgi:hypothetical protein